MSLYFRCNGLAVRLIEDEGVITSPALHYRQGNRTHRIPLIPPDGACYNATQTVKYAYSASAGRTLHVIYHGSRYVVPNTIRPLTDIPAGTYAGYTAYGIFKNFISPNAYRVLKNKITVSHRESPKHSTRGRPSGSPMPTAARPSTSPSRNSEATCPAQSPATTATKNGGQIAHATRRLSNCISERRTDGATLHLPFPME